MSDLIKSIESDIFNLKTKAAKQNVGKVVEVGDGIAKIEGLSEVQASELIEFRLLRIPFSCGRVTVHNPD